VVTFDEVAGSTLSGVTINGITFTEFGPPGSVAGISTVSNLTHLSGRAGFFDGTTGAYLQLDFAAPVTSLTFGFANVSPDLPLAAVGTVQLFGYGPTQSFDVTGVWNAVAHQGEALFSYSGAPVNRVILTAAGAFDNHQGMIDNITFSAVPEPGSFAVVALASMAAALAHQFRHRQQS